MTGVVSLSYVAAKPGSVSCVMSFRVEARSAGTEESPPLWPSPNRRSAFPERTASASGEILRLRRSRACAQNDITGEPLPDFADGGCPRLPGDAAYAI